MAVVATAEARAAATAAVDLVVVRAVAARAVEMAVVVTAEARAVATAAVDLVAMRAVVARAVEMAVGARAGATAVGETEAARAVAAMVAATVAVD